jgi:glycosyltransferase involved in cell wall biosynthesis
MKRRILICSNAYPPNFIGGAELIAHQQAKVLKNLDHEVVIFTGERNGYRKRYSMHTDVFDGLTVYRVSLLEEDYHPEFLNFFHPIVEDHFNTLLERFDPDVVHMHNLIGLSVGLIHAAKRRGIKTVLTLHDHWGFCFKNTLLAEGDALCQDHTACERCMPYIQDEGSKGIPIRMRKDFLAMQLNEVDAFISPSEYLAGAYQRAGFPPDRLRVIWYGIDVQRLAAISKTRGKGAVRFSFIGYLGRHKGVHTLLNALPFLGDKRRVQINIAGSGHQMDEYIRQVKSMGWEDRVKFWGKVDNRRIEGVFRETDVLILPSIWPENQPVTITEAMAARCPVIASRIGGIPELVEDYQTGFLFEPGNAEQLAAKMMEFITHPDLVRIMGERAYQKIKPNTFENRIEQILNLYDEIPLRERDQQDEVLVVCLGQRISSQCSQAIDLIVQDGLHLRCRFVLNDWIQDDQRMKANLLWVVDQEVARQAVMVALKNKIPLLVPEHHAELKDLCCSANCGLYYRDPLEAEACIRYLMHHGSAAHAMGRNGYHFFLRKDLG